MIVWAGISVYGYAECLVLCFSVYLDVVGVLMLGDNLLRTVLSLCGDC